MKKIKEKIPFIINVAVIVIPFMIVTNWVFNSLELNINPTLKFSVSGVVALIIFGLSLGIHTILHEFGHLVTGLISGYKYVFFRIWKYALVKENNNYKIKNFHIPGTLGQCLMAPPKRNEENEFPFLLYNLGGIIFNFIFAIVGIIIVFFNPINLLSSFFLGFSLVGIYLGATNAYPFMYVPNDGTNIKSLLRSDDSKKAFYNALLLNELTVKNKVTKRELKKYVSKDKYKDFEEPVVQGIVSEHVSVLIEENKLLEGLKLANFLLKQKNMSFILRDLIRLDKMAIFLLLGDKKGIESLINNKSFKKAFNSKGDSSIERLKYMYYSLYEKDNKNAETALSNFYNLTENSLINSNIEYDKKLIEYTNTRIHWEEKMLKLDSINSTNDYLKKLISEGSSVEYILSKTQTSGKGQRDKNFYSPEGGMYLSVKITPSEDTNLFYLTARAGILVVESIKKAIKKDVKLKWLNDLIYKDRKIGGILTESSFNSKGELEYVIIGIGLNLKRNEKIPDELEEIYGTLEVKNTEYVISAILYYLIPMLKELEKNVNIHEFVRKYNKYLYNINEEIFIINNDEIIKGKLKGIDKNLNIILDIDDTVNLYSYNDTKILYNYEETDKGESDD